MDTTIPEDFYKYKSAVQQISSESSESFILLEMGTDMKGESLLIKLKDSLYPYKNISLPEVLFKANIVKSLFIETIKIIFNPRPQNILDAFNRIAFRITSDAILKDKHWSKFGKALHFFIFTFLVECGFEEKSSDRFAEIFVFLIDADNAYRLRLEDLFSASSQRLLRENPRKELNRVIEIYRQREINPTVNGKFLKVAKLLTYALYIRKYKKAFVKTIEVCDYKNLELDDGDSYWSVMRTDYNFMGMNYKLRQEYAKQKGWTYPKQIMNKQINDDQIQQIIQALQKANIGVNDFIAIQQMLQTLPTIVPKIEDKTK